MPLSLAWEALGGLGLFVLGMKFMSEGLQKFAGERLRLSLEKVTGNRITAALMGSCLASLLQSSSAASILVIGFLNAGLMSVYQALGVLLGTGVGTTLAIQFIAFKVTSLASPAIFCGVCLRFFGKRRRWVYAGELILGAGLIFFGLQVMENAFSPIRETALMQGVHAQLLSSRVASVFLGALLTFLVQSGSTVIAIVIALAGSGLVGYESAAALVVGEVLGTSLITIIATIGGTLAAKRTAFMFFLVNAFSVAMALLFFPSFLKIVRFVTPHGPTLSVARYLANAHTIFNLSILLVFLPLIGFFARSATRILPGLSSTTDFEPRTRFLDLRVLNTPQLAMLQARNEVKRMAEIAATMYGDVVKQFYKYDAKRTGRIEQKEEALDVLQRDITHFLVALSREPIGGEYLLAIPIMLSVSDNLEHMGDQCEAVLDYLRRKKEEKVIFSNAAMTELRNLAALVSELVVLAESAVREEIGHGEEELRNTNASVIEMQEAMLTSHLKRLTDGKCTVQAGLIYSDIVAAFGKIATYAVTIIETQEKLTHETTSGSD